MADRRPVMNWQRLFIDHPREEQQRHAETIGQDRTFHKAKYIRAPNTGQTPRPRLPSSPIDAWLFDLCGIRPRLIEEKRGKHSL
jgi:hypothetical protein